MHQNFEYQGGKHVLLIKELEKSNIRENMLMTQNLNLNRFSHINQDLVHLAFNCYIYLFCFQYTFQGSIDFSKEAEKLKGKHEKTKQQLEKLTETTKKEDYSSKVWQINQCLQFTSERTGLSKQPNYSHIAFLGKIYFL